MNGYNVDKTAAEMSTFCDDDGPNAKVDKRGPRLSYASACPNHRTMLSRYINGIRRSAEAQ